MAIRINAAARAAQGAARRARTREKLLAGAVDVIARHGVDVTIDQVVAAAGVSRGAFYNHFPTVDDLTQALAEQLAEDARQDLAVRLALVSEPAAQMAASGHYYLRRARREPVWAWAVLNVSERRSLHFPTVPRVFRSIHRRGVEAGVFAPDDATSANIVVAGVVRAAQRHVLNAAPPPAFDHDAIVMLLRALGVPGGAAETISRDAAAVTDAALAA